MKQNNYEMNTGYTLYSWLREMDEDEFQETLAKKKLEMKAFNLEQQKLRDAGLETEDSLGDYQDVDGLKHIPVENRKGNPYIRLQNYLDAVAKKEELKYQPKDETKGVARVLTTGTPQDVQAKEWLIYQWKGEKETPESWREDIVSMAQSNNPSKLKRKVKPSNNVSKEVASNNAKLALKLIAGLIAFILLLFLFSK